MACNPVHSNQRPADGIHTPISYEYANAAARTGATGFDSDDLGKFAWQQDDDTVWLLTAVTPTWVQVGFGSSGMSTPQLMWGDDGIATSTTDRFLSPGFDDAIAETSPTEFRLIRDGTLKTMRVHHTTAGVGAATLTYTLLINGTPTSLSVPILTTAQDGSDLANTVSVSAGDIATLRVSKSAAITTSPDNITVTVEYA